MEFSLLFYLSILTVMIGAGIGSFFIAHSLTNKSHNFSLWIGSGFLVVYLFQVPKILANANIQFILEDFGVFLIVSLFLSFFGWCLIFIGLSKVFPGKYYKSSVFSVMILSLLNLVFHIYLFASGGIEGIYSGVLVNVFLFLIPINLLILISVWRWHHHASWLSSFRSRMSIILIASGITLNIIRMTLIAISSSSYTSVFRFFHLASNEFFFISQSITALLVAAGFMLIHKVCCVEVDKN